MVLSSKQVSVDINNWPQAGLEFSKPEGQEEKKNAALLKCPRCESTNTKFCYYNNYSRSQPRHFCRACRRHWTEGGILRNIPVGGGRKNKRRKITPTANSSAGAADGDPTVPLIEEMEGPTFPHILRQVPLQPTPSTLESPTFDTANGLFGNSLSNSSPTFMEDFNGGLVSSEGKIPFTAAASSCSFSSLYNWKGVQDVGGECEDDLLEGTMGSSTASDWVKKETVLPANYWDFWDGGSAVFNDADAVEPVLPW